MNGFERISSLVRSKAWFLSLPLAFILGLATPFASAATWGQPGGYVELHSHLFMPEGLWPLARDPFEAPPKSENYRDRFRSRATARSLETTDAQIVVASLYAHPWLNRSPRESLRRQIAEAERFVKEHPTWILARHSSEAKAALATGKRVLVLHLEGADGILEREEDFHEWIDRAGLRIVTPLHLTDDAFGGCAFLPGIHALSNPLPFLRSALSSLWNGAHFDTAPPTVRLNPRGLTPVGEDLILALLKRKVWIDLAHASDASLERILPLLRKAGQPLLHTHTALRTEIAAERGISRPQLAEVEASGGLIGLMPTEQMLGDRDVSESLCAFSCERGPCRHGIAAFAREWQEARAILGPGAITIGSDHQGGVPGLHPTCQSGTSLDQTGRGYTRMNQTAELFSLLQRLQVRTPDEGPRGVDRFLRAWERVEKAP